MATIVKHIESGHRYILLGTGYGAFQSDNFRFFSEREGQIEAAAVCTIKEPLNGLIPATYRWWRLMVNPLGKLKA